MKTYNKVNDDRMDGDECLYFIIVIFIFIAFVFLSPGSNYFYNISDGGDILYMG